MGAPCRWGDRRLPVRRTRAAVRRTHAAVPRTLAALLPEQPPAARRERVRQQDTVADDELADAPPFHRVAVPDRGAIPRRVHHPDSTIAPWRPPGSFARRPRSTSPSGHTPPAR